MSDPTSPPKKISFDARGMIAAGEEPLSLILKQSALIAEGESLEVLAPFEPIPLHGVLGERGFIVANVEHDPSTQTWTTLYTRVRAAPVRASPGTGD